MNDRSSSAFCCALRKGREMNSFRVRNVNGMVGEGVKFERIRRITGYLSGSTSRWNEGKSAELRDRVIHKISRSKRNDAV